MKSTPGSVLSALMVAIFCLWSASCGPDRVTPGAAKFREFYHEVDSTAASSQAARFTGKKLQLTAEGVPLVSLLRTISDQSGISVICEQSLDNSPVSLEIKNGSVDEILSVIARRLGRRLTRIGSVWYLGEIAPEDRGFLVRRVRRLAKDDLDKVLESFRSEFGRGISTTDGLVVVTDRVEVLERLAQALEQVEQAPSSTWIIQLYVVSLSDHLQHSLGLSLDSDAKLALTYQGFNNGTEGYRTDLTGGFTAILESTHEDSSSGILASPLLLVRDGGSSTIKRGQVIPVAKKTVSPYGTVTTTGYDQVESGLGITVNLRDDGPRYASAHVLVDLSTITSFTVDGYPQLAKQSLDCWSVLKSGGVYLLGSLTDSAQGDSIHGKVAPSIRTWSKDANQIQIWARVYRTADPVTGGAAELSAPLDKSTALGSAAALAAGDANEREGAARATTSEAAKPAAPSQGAMALR